LAPAAGLAREDPYADLRRDDMQFKPFDIELFFATSAFVVVGLLALSLGVNL
jgi:hypothetical protein